jgi:hypothetical protein
VTASLRYKIGVSVQIEIELGKTFELRGEIIVTDEGCISRFLRGECEPAIRVTPVESGQFALPVWIRNRSDN